jgi:hypothetical protein
VIGDDDPSVFMELVDHAVAINTNVRHQSGVFLSVVLGQP